MRLPDSIPIGGRPAWPVERPFGARSALCDAANAVAETATLLQSVLAADADLAVVFKNRKMYVGDGRTPGGAKRRLELMLGQSLAVHHVPINVPIVNDDLWLAL